MRLAEFEQRRSTSHAALGHPDAGWLTPESLAQLEYVAELADLAEKRAAWWWWLVQRLIERRDELSILRDEDLIGGRDEIARMLRAGPGGPVRKAAVSEAESHPALDERDRQAIRAICMQAAAHLGVQGEPWGVR